MEVFTKCCIVFDTPCMSEKAENLSMKHSKLNVYQKEPIPILLGPPRDLAGSPHQTFSGYDLLNSENGGNGQNPTRTKQHMLWSPISKVPDAVLW